MANAKDVKEFKETFKRFDQYVNGEIPWREFDMSGVRKRSTPMTKSEIDKIFVELGTRGEDRVFRASKFSGNPLHPTSVSVKPKPKDVINVELQTESCVDNHDKDEKKTENQLQIPKKPLENIVSNEDWVVIDNNDKDFEFC